MCEAIAGDDPDLFQQLQDGEIVRMRLGEGKGEGGNIPERWPARYGIVPSEPGSRRR